jgi:hypothetical protein
MNNFKGIKKLYKGSIYEIIAQTLSTGIYFGCYESGTKFIAFDRRGKLFWQVFLGFGVSYCYAIVKIGSDQFRQPSRKRNSNLDLGPLK